MGTLVITASAHGKRSLTLKLAAVFAESFAEASGQEIQVLDLYEKEFGPCKGCLSCWYKTPGRCVLNDEGNAILDAIRAADHVIWTCPLYFFGFPSEMKKLQDRLMPFIKPEITYDALGRTTHPGFAENGSKHVLITSGAFPQVEGNFDGMFFQMKRIFGEDVTLIACCASTTMLLKKREELQPYVERYTETLKKAGKEYAENGRISEETQKILNAPPMPKDRYIDIINGKK